MKALILDFDQTMADTSSLAHLRQSRNWPSVYAALHKIKVYPGIAEVIEEARKREYKIAVVTNSPKKYCELALASVRVKVDAVVGYHDTSKRKPFPDPILLALKLVNANASSSVGLGDNVNDILAYKAAGITSIACLWGCENKEDLSKVSPSVVCADAYEIINYLAPSPN